MNANTSANGLPTTVVIVEDHSLIRDGLRMLMALERDFRLVGEAGSVADANKLLASVKPDLAIIDIGLPDGDGIDFAESALKTNPTLRILMLTGDLSPLTVTRALAIGAHGYVQKQYNADELFTALNTLREGGRYVSRTVASSYSPPKPEVNRQSTLTKLTPRESEIVQLLTTGDSSKHIARKLDLSVATVRKHRENIMAKLEVHSIAELIALALKTPR